MATFNEPANECVKVFLLTFCDCFITFPSMISPVISHSVITIFVIGMSLRWNSIARAQTSILHSYTYVYIRIGR